MMNGWGTGWGIFPFILTAGLIVGGFFFVRWIIQKSGKNGLIGREPGAMEILKKRYANGGITRDEYLEIKAALEEENKS